MKFNFRKIASVIASAVMIGSTAGIALGANYPAPFVVSGTENGAIVVGASAAGSDWAAATTAANALNQLVTGGSSSGSVSGEAYALYTGSTKIYMNDSLNAVRSTLTDTELPTILADGTFEGDVSADYWQNIKVGSNPKVIFSQAPTSDDDPIVNIQLGYTATDYAYNTSVSFSRAVNFTDADSKGQSLNLFGSKFTIGTDTSSTELVMYKSSESVTLGKGGSNPTSQTVTLDGKEYTVELISASDTAATLKVTDADGNTETKTVSENTSKKIQGIEVAVQTADESNFELIATLSVGAQKVVLEDGAEVKMGSDETAVDGTLVEFGTTNPTNMTSLMISVFASEADEDAILEGQSFTDPVFGSFKIDFAGLNIAADSTARENIAVKASGNDKATLKMTSHSGSEQSVEWYYNSSAGAKLADSDGHRIHVMERDMVNKSDYVVVGNEDEGYLLQVKRIYNASTAMDSEVTLQDVFCPTCKSYQATITSDADGTLDVAGRSYPLTYVDSRTVSGDEYLRLDYPDSTTSAYAIVYPTIQTSKGANLAFYEPLTINLADYDGIGTDLAGLMFPNGDTYTSVALAINATSVLNGTWETTYGQLNTSMLDSVNFSVGKLAYNLTTTGTLANTTILYMSDVGGGNLVLPAIVMFEEKDDNSEYQAVVVEMEGGSSAYGVGVSDVQRTWSTDNQWDNIHLESNDDLYKDMDLWGTIATTDVSDSDQYSAVISYPDEQIYAQIYVASLGATTSAAQTGGTGGNVLVVKDTEVSNVKTKNLVVIGGSCVNSVAAKIVGATYPTCGADWTTKTSVGAGQYIIKAVKASEAVEGGSESKVAVLVAGYEAADTVNAVNKLKEGAVTDSGTSNVYPITTA